MTSSGPEGVVRATARHDLFLRALGASSGLLLSGSEIEGVFAPLLEGLAAAPGIMMTAYFEPAKKSNGKIRWRLCHASSCEARDGNERWQDAAAIVLETGVDRWFEDRSQGGARVASGAIIVRQAGQALRCGESHSIVLAPVFCQETLRGLLWIGANHEASAWQEGELGALGEAARCLGMAMENREARRATTNKLAQQQALIEAGLTVSGSLDLSTVLERLAEQMGRAIGVTSVYLSDWNEETSETTVVAEYYAPEASARERISDLGVTYNLEEDFGDDLSWLTTGKIEAAQVTDPDLSQSEREHMEMYGARSTLVVPFQVEGRIVGYAELWESRYDRAFSAQEIELCRRMARQGAIAFENARLYEEVRQRINELELVHQVAVATARVVDIDRLLAETTKFIAERIYPDVFGFVLRDEANGEFRPHASYHGLPQRGLEMTVPKDRSITGQVVATGQALIIPDVQEEPLYFPIVEETRSEIAVPMLSEGEAIGVINVESRRRNAFSASDLRFLRTLAGQMVTAIERARLYEDLEKHAVKLAAEVERRTLELQEERDRMLAILDSAGEGILFTDVDARILYVNPALEWQTGYTREECLGKRPNMWRNPETDGAIFDEMWATLLGGKRWRGELVNYHKDGSSFDAALTITPLNDAEGKLSGFVGVQADISRLKEVERLKSKFIANVSHELRTPLTNIRTYVSLLERGEATRRKRYMAVIKQESERLTRLIQDLLVLSRLEARAPVEEVQCIDVGGMVDDVANTFAAQAEKKQIALESMLYGPLPAVQAARPELQQVLGNLLGNALAYTPPGGRVLVSAGCASKDEQPMVWIRVEDNGPGICATEIPRLFERFYRGEAARRSGAPGTGLGLAISKEILENYGGGLELDSVLGEGTLFTVWLPAGQEEEGAAQ